MSICKLYLIIIKTEITWIFRKMGKKEEKEREDEGEIKSFEFSPFFVIHE